MTAKEDPPKEAPCAAEPPAKMPKIARRLSEPGFPLQKRNKVVVRVPATSANLGPGFDAVGMAVDIWNEITVERADEFSIQVEGEGASLIPLALDLDGEL